MTAGAEGGRERGLAGGPESMCVIASHFMSFHVTGRDSSHGEGCVTRDDKNPATQGMREAGAGKSWALLSLGAGYAWHAACAIIQGLKGKYLGDGVMHWRSGPCVHPVLACLAVVCGLFVCGAEQIDASRRPYRVAHEAPLKASESLVKDGPDYRQFRVEFEGIEGDRVPGYLYVPQKAKGRRPAVLLQYGSGGSKSTPYIVEFGQRFAANGFVALTIDSAMRGERAPKQNGQFNLFATQFSREMFLHYCGDYSRAVDYLVSRLEVDPSRLSYVGISWGAITGITFVAHEPRIREMAAMVAGGNFLGPIFGGAREAEKIAREIDPVYQVGQIGPRPLLLLNVTRDRLIPRKYAEALHRAAGPGAEVVWLDTDHDFRENVDRREVADRVIKFIKDHLPGR